MKYCQCVAVLDTMWGGSGNAPGMFRINPDNHSGRRLYWLLGHQDLLVTNACREYVADPTIHGTPDPAWLAKNLRRMRYDLLLVCGKVAQQTYAECDYVPECRVLLLPHPAARTWTRASLDAWRQCIQGSDS